MDLHVRTPTLKKIYSISSIEELMQKADKLCIEYYDMNTTDSDELLLVDGNVGIFEPIKGSFTMAINNLYTNTYKYQQECKKEGNG